MAKKKAQARRQPPRSRHRTSAAAARARQQQRRRGIVSAVVATFIVIALVGLAVGFGAGSKKATTTTSSSTSSTTTPPTSASLPSARGKPCLALSDPLPKGAPAVPVQTGPPPTKLVTRDLKVGAGAVVKAGQTLSVDYVGVSCSTGRIFDSSYSRGQPASFSLSGVIPGWQQGIPGMRVGGERLLGIPPNLGYGSAGRTGIAPDETLWFVVHVNSAK